LSTLTGSILHREKNLPFFFIASKKENFIPRLIGVDIEEFNLVIGSDLANWEDNFAVVADA